MKKIEIRKSEAADTRSAKELVTKEKLFISSKQHIQDVGMAMAWLCAYMMAQAQKHDYTKLDNIDEFHKDFAFIQSGQLGDFKKMKWFNDIHLTERHHLNDRCPDNVNLVDVIEMLCDCVMAGMARTGKVFPITISTEILTKAVSNTVELLKANTELTQN